MGKRMQTENLLGALVRGEHRASVSDERVRVEGMARFEHHPGGHLLAPPFVRDPGDCGLFDARVLLEDDLDLARKYVHPSADDHLLAPASDDQVAGGTVESPNVAGAEPSLGCKRRRGGFDIAPVTAEDLRPAKLDPPSAPASTSAPSSPARRTSSPGSGTPMVPESPSSRGSWYTCEVSRPLSVVP